jgi:hypothetical protein
VAVRLESGEAAISELAVILGITGNQDRAG